MGKFVSVPGLLAKAWGGVMHRETGQPRQRPRVEDSAQNVGDRVTRRFPVEPKAEVGQFRHSRPLPQRGERLVRQVVQGTCSQSGSCEPANCLGVERLPVKPGSPTCAVPGWDLRVMDKDGNEAPAGEIGALVAKLPMPPGSSPTLWNAEERYRETYLSAFPGSYQTADAGYIDEDGYVFVMARTDDIINTAGHRLSTGAMEEVLAAHPDVAECAVVGVADDLRGQLPAGFLVLKAGVDRPHDEIVAEVVQLVRHRIGPVAAFKSAVVVARLPKTRSGKILRGTMRRIADGEPYTTPATIDDPAILDEVGDALRTIGYAEAPVSA